MLQLTVPILPPTWACNPYFHPNLRAFSSLLQMVQTFHPKRQWLYGKRINTVIKIKPCLIFQIFFFFKSAWTMFEKLWKSSQRFIYLKSNLIWFYPKNLNTHKWNQSKEVKLLNFPAPDKTLNTVPHMFQFFSLPQASNLKMKITEFCLTWETSPPSRTSPGFHKNHKSIPIIHKKEVWLPFSEED